MEYPLEPYFFFHRVTDVRPCHLFQRSCIGSKGHRSRDSHLVCDPGETVVDPAARGISDRLAYPLFFDGNFGVADLGGAAVLAAYAGTRCIRYPTFAKCSLVTYFLWQSQFAGWTDRDPAFGRCNCGDDCHRY